MTIKVIKDNDFSLQVEMYSPRGVRYNGWHKREIAEPNYIYLSVSPATLVCVL